MIRRICLIGVNGALLAGALWASFAPPSVPEVARDASQAPTTPVRSATLPVVDASTVPIRSLFRPMPPPPAPPAAAPMPVMPPPPQLAVAPPPPETPLRLVGLIDHSSEVAAFIEVGGRREIVRHVVGETLEGWTITEIRRREIVLVKSGATRILPLDPLKAP